ncbi:hypothetical protein [Paraflavitalea speifideaquila]|uniref:hypothetical protein n=1 Tax=Paraflavitalea speifideaquila TaxID=3076558 RepID=UPI0028EB0894|nr:hypothetical protein [Paraflavitalea speifideiaquila]
MKYLILSLLMIAASYADAQKKPEAQQRVNLPLDFTQPPKNILTSSTACDSKTQKAWKPKRKTYSNHCQVPRRNLTISDVTDNDLLFIAKSADSKFSLVS